MFLASFFLFNAHAQAEVLDRILAVVNGKPITLSEYNEREAPLSKQISDKFSGAEKEKRLSELKKKVMDYLIEDLLLEQEAEKLGMKVSERDIDDAIEDVKKQNQLNDETLISALKKEGLDYYGYRSQIKKQIEKSRVIGQQVRSKVNVTEKELQEYYERNQKIYLKDHEVKVSHILFIVPEKADDAEKARIRAQAEDVLNMARKGDDFSVLAKKYSQDATGKEGGSLGYFKRGEILPAFEEVVFTLKKGDISDLVRTSYGFHIIRIDDVQEAVPQTFESVKEKIKSIVTSEMLEQRYKEWMEELKKSAIIEMKE